MKKIIILFVVFCISLLFLSLVNIQDVNATSYYNWIKGSEMESTTNYIEDGTAESGSFNSGILYGNWSGTGEVSSSLPYNGVYSFFVDSGSTETLWYNFTDEFLGIDVNNFYAWFYCVGTHLANDFKIYYNDYTYTDSSIDLASADTWVKVDLSSTINDNKYIVALFFQADSQDMYIDDLFLGIEDEISQGQYDVDTYPWRTTGLLSYWQSIGYTDFPTFIPFLTYRMYPTGALIDVDMIGHNLIWGRNSNGSGYIGYDESTAQFIQDIDYLDSDSVHFIDLWVYTDYTTSVGVKINIIYSDRTFDTKTANITQVSTWEHLNFGGAWIDDNKVIVQIQISLANYIPAYVNIDDIGLWSSLPSNFHRFTYTVSPSALSQTSIGFNAYMGQTYTFTGYLYDINGELNENGTVTISHNYGSTVATLSLGIFTFTINPRTGASDFTEMFGISVNNGENVELYQLTVNWIYVSGGGGGSQQERSNNLLDWIIMFCVIFLPAILFSGGIYENNQQPDSMHISPIFGLIAGLCLSIGIGVYTTVLPLWLLILMIVAIVILLIGMFK